MPGCVRRCKIPGSMPYNMSRIAQTVRRVQPRSLLDIGAGFGKFGVIFREYLDILPGRYNKDEWLTRIDAIEVHTPYITDLHRYVYDNIYETDIWEFDWPQDYDLVFMGDVIEHFAKSEAIDLLKMLKTKLVLISTPTGVDKKGSCYRGNSHEEHKHIWTLDEFKRLDGWMTRRTGQDNYMLTILLERT